LQLLLLNFVELLNPSVAGKLQLKKRRRKEKSSAIFVMLSANNFLRM
jgi:hypothetical protein